MKKLSAAPVRTDHTDRECSQFLMGVIAGLCSLASPTDVRNAFRYWASSDSQEQWDAIAKLAVQPAPEEENHRMRRYRGRPAQNKKPAPSSRRG